MAVTVATISPEEATTILAVEEGQFDDVKSREIQPADLSKHLSAFANSDGGDLYIGIDEVGPDKHRQWRGFNDPEAANGHLQAFETLFPLDHDCNYEFMRCAVHPGLVLRVQVLKTKRIV